MPQRKTSHNITAQRKDDDFIVVPTCCGLVVVSHHEEQQQQVEPSLGTPLAPQETGAYAKQPGTTHGKSQRQPVQALPLDTVLSSLTWLLLAIAAITTVIEEKSNVLAIAATLFTITAVGLFSEYKARQSQQSGRSSNAASLRKRSLGQHDTTTQLN